MLIALMLVVSAAAADLPPDATGKDSIDLARVLLPHATAHRTGRYVVLSDGDRPVIRSVEFALEETRRQYDRWCRAMRLPPPRPDERLLCILFHEQEDFVAFAEQTEGLAATAQHVSGYFSPRFDWIVCFDPWDSTDLTTATQSLDNADADIESAAARGADPEQVAEARRKVIAARVEVQEEERARRTAVTIHEAVHQLVHVGDAFPGRANWPGWLHEGVAVAFETDNHRGPFGPDRSYAPRVNGIRQAVAADRHIPLQELLAGDTIDHADGDHTGILYDQAGSLFCWLYKRNRQGLAAFLADVGVPDATGVIPAPEDVFTRTLGPPASIERRWIANVLR